MSKTGLCRSNACLDILSNRRIQTFRYCSQLPYRGSYGLELLKVFFTNSGRLNMYTRRDGLLRFQDLLITVVIIDYCCVFILLNAYSVYG